MCFRVYQEPQGYQVQTDCQDPEAMMVFVDLRFVIDHKLNVSFENGAYWIGEQRRLRQVCACVQSH